MLAVVLCPSRRSLSYFKELYGEDYTCGMLSDMFQVMRLTLSDSHLLIPTTAVALPLGLASPQEPDLVLAKIKSLMPWLGQLMNHVGSNVIIIITEVGALSV